jgi:hypothetical protein
MREIRNDIVNKEVCFENYLYVLYIEEGSNYTGVTILLLHSFWPVDLILI